MKTFKVVVSITLDTIDNNVDYEITRDDAGEAVRVAMQTLMNDGYEDDVLTIERFDIPAVSEG